MKEYTHTTEDPKPRAADLKAKLSPARKPKTPRAAKEPKAPKPTIEVRNMPEPGALRGCPHCAQKLEHHEDTCPTCGHRTR